MGGGSSKSDVKAIKQSEADKKQKAAPQQSAQKEAGPASRPNIDMSPSPAISKKSGKSANL